MLRYKLPIFTILTIFFPSINKAHACTTLESVQNAFAYDGIWIGLVFLLALNFIYLLTRHFKKNRNLFLLNLSFLFILLMPHIFIGIDNYLFPEDKLSITFGDGKRALEMPLEEDPIHTSYTALQYLAGAFICFTGFFKSAQFYYQKLKKITTDTQLSAQIYYIIIGIIFILIPLLMEHLPEIDC